MNGARKKHFYFLNPFRNHSIVTISALSVHNDVCILCPPIKLGIFLGIFKKESIKESSYSLKQHIVLLFCTVSFILYKTRVLNYISYITFFRYCAQLFVEHDSSLVYYYQDYLNNCNFAHNRRLHRVCEFIINVAESDENWTQTLIAIEDASIIVVPTAYLQNKLLQYTSKSIVLVKYGGDMLSYLRHQKVNDKHCFDTPSHGLCDLESQPFVIVARCNTERKGVDVLLDSIAELNQHLQACNSSRLRLYRLNIFIAGQPDKKNLDRFTHVSELLASNPSISISAKSYNALEYQQLLKKAHLFIMLSKLESSSIAALEALWHCVPCVLTEGCGVDGFLHNIHGYLLQDRSSTELTAVLSRLFSYNRSSLDRWRFNLPKYRESFSWNSYILSLGEVFEMLDVLN